MIDIQEFEEAVLIEADYFNYSVGNLVNDIAVRNKNLDTAELHKIACNVIAVLWIQGFITVVKAEYRQVDDEAFEAVSAIPLDDRETEDFLKSSDNWSEIDVYSETSTHELEITEKGRRYLEEVIRAPR